VLADPAAGTAILILVTSGGVFLASSASKLYGLHGPEGVRAYNLMYGRYNEAIAVVLAASAIAWLCQTRLRVFSFSWRTAAAAAVVATIMVLTAVVVDEIDDALARHAAATPGAVAVDRVPPGSIQASSVPGIFPLIVGFGGLDPPAISAVSIGVFILIVVVMQRSKRIGLGLVVAIFLACAVANHLFHFKPNYARTASRLVFASRLSSIGPIPSISYDSGYHDQAFYGGLQYLASETVFTRFSSRDDETPRDGAVISGNDWSQAERLGAKFYVSAGRVNSALWLMPGRLRSTIVRWAPEGDILGREPVIGVRANGFHSFERNAGRLGRWTDGAATLTAHVNRRQPPLMLGVEIAGTGRARTELELRANGVTLWNQPIPNTGGAATFDLEHVPIEDPIAVEILSDTILVEKPAGGPGPGRTLGVFVCRVSLGSREALAAAATGGLLLGAEQVLGYPETGFFGAERHGDVAARWTNGAASLRIPLHPKHLPERLEISTVAPGRDSAHLRVRANGVVLWDRLITSGPWSRVFSLAGVPLGDELRVGLESDTFCPADTIDGSADRRNLGVKVISIRLVRGDGLNAGWSD
jgi:hypothetical protein